MTTVERLHFRAPLGAIVIIHLFVLLWHGAMRLEIPVPLTASETIFVALIVFLTPLAGAGLLWTGYSRVLVDHLVNDGFLTIRFHQSLHSRRAGLCLGRSLNIWRHSFVVSAALLAVVETVGTMMGVVALAPKVDDDRLAWLFGE